MVAEAAGTPLRTPALSIWFSDGGGHQPNHPGSGKGRRRTGDVAGTRPRALSVAEAGTVVRHPSGEPEIVVLDPAAFASLAARRLAAELPRVLQSHEVCSLALSGGSTHRPVYQRLAAELPDPGTLEPGGRLLRRRAPQARPIAGEPGPELPLAICAASRK
ncbi:MAG: 6-phosphogluconolactonase [Gemmatimonadales bacterium]|nr:6-phosphogluconolactonase [Gemmatimonadales bacterium]